MESGEASERMPDDVPDDEEGGPLVRPYAMTGGRTRHRGTDLDLVTVVRANTRSRVEDPWLGPEHETILRLCTRPLSVAEVAADLDLPLGVVRVMLGDLLERGLITATRAAAESPRTDRHVLQQVLDGIKAL